MTDTITGLYKYENLKDVCELSSTTRLCICEPEHKLYTVKRTDRSCLASCRAISSLDNPHLAKIIYVSDKEDCTEVVCEYISGDTLADLIKKKHTFDENDAVRIISDVCDGLSCIHKLGCVHRDVTPNNVIISHSGGAILIDYGITRFYKEDKTSDTSILGTPGYAAPEQFGFTQSDARTDIYAVGVLFNVLLTGKMPNEKIADGSLGKIIRKCTEIDSEKRYKSIDEVRKAVMDRAPGSSPIDRAILQMPGIRSRHTAVVILACIGYIAAIVFSVALFATAEKSNVIPTIIVWILCFPIPFFCFHNFLDIWNRLPFSRGASRKNQRIVYTVLGILSIFFGLCVIGTCFNTL